MDAQRQIDELLEQLKQASEKQSFYKGSGFELIAYLLFVSLRDIEPGQLIKETEKTEQFIINNLNGFRDLSEDEKRITLLTAVVLATKLKDRICTQNV